MQRFFWGFPLLLVSLLPVSCRTIRESPKYELKDGIYSSSFLTRSGNQVYIELHEDSIQAYPAVKKEGEFEVLKETALKSFPEITYDTSYKSYLLYKPSIDLDLVTVAFKYRPESEGFPRQLNSNLGGALYLGTRYDIFRIAYDTNPIGMNERRIQHYGISAGVFACLGSVFIGPWFVNDQIDYEYDGVVFMKGASILAGINQFTAGLAIGTDQLLDKNRKFWIYQNRLWIGLVFGVNLN